MTSEKMQEWLSRIWGPNVDDVRRLLVLDQAPIHKTEAAKNAFEERDTDVLYVPEGCTSILQPADVYWNKPFKSTLRRLWQEYMRKEERTPKGNLKKPSRQHVLDFVAEAWAAVPEETVARSFKGCGITNALDGSEDGDLHGRLADVGAVAPEDRGALRAECCELFFATDSEDSFDGFESN
uniref:Putative transposase n=1 Tax=Amblyomma sculptum TaxID=1581419 RepID=A0A1E1XNV4_AMBSC